MDKPKISVALIGCGKMGWKYDDVFLVSGNFSHAAAVAANPAFYLTAVCDSNLDSARDCGRKYGVAKAFSSVSEMMQSDYFDVVVVATPPSAHLSTLKAVLSAHAPPKVIVMEKPLANDLDEASEMLAMSESADCQIVLNYSRRFSPEITASLAKFVGQECRVFGTYSGGILSNGTHWFDLLQMAGFRAREVRGIPPVTPLPGGDFQVDIMIRSELGSSAFLQCLPSGFPSIFEFTVMSREARFNISDSGFALEDGILTPSLIIEGAQNYLRVGKRTGDMAGNLDRLYDHVARIIKQEEEPFCTVENGLHPLEIAFAAKESAERGGFPIALI